jgi:hypothetical protein
MNDLIGKRATDTITGLSGTVTGHCEYITGCNQALIQPPVDKEGKMVTGSWIDVDRLKVDVAPAISLQVKDSGPCDPVPIR